MRSATPLLLLLVGHASASGASSRTYKMYHRFGSEGEFTERGSVVLSAGDGGGNGTELTATATSSDGCLVPSAVDAMVAAGPGSLYSVRLVDEVTGRAASASVPGCDLRRAGFREEVALTLAEDGGLVSASYRPLVSPLAPPCEEMGSLEESLRSGEGGGGAPEFKTTVLYSTSTAAMTVPVVLPKVKPPPGLKIYPRKQRPAEEGGQDAAQSNPFEEDKPESQSFLRKYWYIILPMVLVNIFGAGGEEPVPPSAAGAAAAAGGAVAAGGAPRRRRGKRD